MLEIFHKSALGFTSGSILESSRNWNHNLDLGSVTGEDQGCVEPEGAEFGEKPISDFSTSWPRVDHPE